MKTIAVLTLCLVGAALADPTSVVAQCSTGISNLNSSGDQMVGDIPGGTTIHVGQQFDVDCTAQLLDVTFRLEVDSSVTYGTQTCLAAGDTIACVLMDTDHNELARVERTLVASDGVRDVVFDFSALTYGLNPGSYVVTWENVTKSFLFLHTSGDRYAGGYMHVNTDGAWTEQWTADAYFAVNWDAAGVPDDQLTWGALKADYR